MWLQPFETVRLDGGTLIERYMGADDNEQTGGGKNDEPVRMAQGCLAFPHPLQSFISFVRSIRAARNIPLILF
ncbi:hypothetical protein D3C72_2352180 [compost metagenome]